MLALIDSASAAGAGAAIDASFGPSIIARRVASLVAHETELTIGAAAAPPMTEPLQRIRTARGQEFSDGQAIPKTGMQVVTVPAMREKRRRVLVVEDDRALGGMYRSALRFSGFDVEIATDGLSALRLIDQCVPDVVVLDLHLPRLRGEAILQEIANRADLCDIPVIIVTGSDPSPAVAQAPAILRKPRPPDRLLSVVERIARAA